MKTWACVLALSLAAAGCGYDFGTSLKPSQGRSLRGVHLAVPVFFNDTFEPILDKRVTEFIRKQFLQTDGLTLANDVGAAPLVLKGIVRSYGVQTLSFRQGSVNEQRVSLSVEVTFEDRSARKMLWSQTYTTSAEFFQTSDLATNRTRQDRATEEACQAMAEHIVSHVIETLSDAQSAR
ncbi:MAG: LPS assembly lipoprotein LptE [Nitrospirales bacterium]|nr:LPS assembly lipoprotein LptE [Nitrospirales bacterium]